MHRARSLFMVIIIAVVILPGCLSNDEDPKVEIVSIGSPPLLFFPSQYFTLNVTLDASESMNNVTVNLTGLKNKIGQLKLSKSELVDLEDGHNNISFKFLVPKCSACNKLDPGPYNITVTVATEGTLLCTQNATAQLQE